MRQAAEESTDISNNAPNNVSLGARLFSQIWTPQRIGTAVQNNFFTQSDINTPYPLRSLNSMLPLEL